MSRRVHWVRVAVLTSVCAGCGAGGGEDVEPGGEAEEIAGTSQPSHLSDTPGVAVWTRKVGGDGYQWARGVATDAAGNAYVAGDYTVSVWLGPGDAHVGPSDRTSMFLVKRSP